MLIVHFLSELFFLVVSILPHEAKAVLEFFSLSWRWLVEVVTWRYAKRQGVWVYG